MLKTVLLTFILFTLTYCCNKFPNGTETKLNWFQSCSSPIFVYTMETTDPYGNSEYPLRLTKPLFAHANLTNNGIVLDNLKLDINLFTWGGWSGCEWHPLETLGILNNLDACTNGIICPIWPGNQANVMSLDFTKYDGFIDLLEDDVAYQIQLILTAPNNDQFCMTVQARSRVK